MTVHCSFVDNVCERARANGRRSQPIKRRRNRFSAASGARDHKPGVPSSAQSDYVAGRAGRRRVASATEVQLLNRTDRPSPMPGEAEVKYLDGDFRVVRPGAFVRCAVTGLPIPLEELRYWSVELQEAYVSPEAVLQRHGSLYAGRS
jgi:hypothetical protein